VKSLAQLTHTSESQSFATLIKTLTTFDFSGFPDESMLVKFALAVAGAYLIVQAVKGLIGFFQQLQTQKKIPAQMWDRLRFIVIVAVIGAALFVPMGWAYKGTGLLLVVAALAFEGGRTIAQSFFVNFFGDVQIYTTRDENVDYNAMRDKILELVTTTIVRVSSDDANGGKGYDKVFILAHSLGATVTLDAIMRYHQFIEQAPPVAKDLLVRAFRRIRALVTFGCPLEKTKYFTDVQNPSPSLALDQWRSDAYGPLFTDQPAELLASNAAASAMFWANYWYFADAVANEMESYRSFVPAGANAALGHHLRRTMHDLGPGKKPLGRPLCRNERGHKWWSLPDVIPHGDYLLDDWFWHSSVDPDPKKSHLGVLDIVARTGASPAPAAFGGRTWQQAPPSGPGYAVGPTYEPATPGQAAKFHDFRP
jgi:pimeloyl-ACP methyl ester carboxylesterase